MNERIRELRAKAQELAGQEHHTGRALDLKGMEQVPDFQIFMDRVHTSYEKFAELIVRECIGCCEQVISDPVPESVDTWLNGGSQCIDEIREHFGVEE